MIALHTFSFIELSLIGMSCLTFQQTTIVDNL